MTTPLYEHSIAAASAEIHLAKAAVALELLGFCAADPIEAVPVAIEAGISGGVFADMRDLRCLWAALEWIAERGHDRAVAYSACRFLLMKARLWDEQFGGPLPSDTGMLWGTRKLAALFNSGFRCPAHVKHLSAKLLGLDTNIRDAGHHLREAARLLEIVDEMRFCGRGHIPTATPHVVLAPLKIGKRGVA